MHGNGLITILLWAATCYVFPFCSVQIADLTLGNRRLPGRPVSGHVWNFHLSAPSPLQSQEENQRSPFHPVQFFRRLANIFLLYT